MAPGRLFDGPCETECRGPVAPGVGTPTAHGHPAAIEVAGGMHRGEATSSRTMSARRAPMFIRERPGAAPRRAPPHAAALFDSGLAVP